MTQETGSPNQNPPPVDRLAQLWQRVNDHKIVQWSVAYIALAYAVQHAVELTGEAFEWSPAVLRVSMLLMVLGLPVVLTLAWYHGERASRHFSTAELTIISLLLVIGSVVFYAFVQPQEEIAADQAPPAQQTGVEKARAAAASPRTGISVAVLPFANLSDDRQQEFFSDGMTDEIAGALAKVPDLRVVARSSAFEFKGQNTEARAMGLALGATHLIQGSVRQAGNRVRIAAQLIQADSGLQVWSDNFDRELNDVFAVQEDIATAIAGALRMPLGLRPGESLVSNRNIDPESYQQYLRAKALYRARLGPNGGSRALNEAVALLAQVVARNPDFAPAWALTASVHDTIPNYTGVFNPNRTATLAQVREVSQASISKAEPAVRKALQLDPDLSEGHRIMASMQARAGHPLQAEDFYSKSLSSDPNNPETLNAYANFLVIVGRVKEALDISQEALALEPFVPIFNRDRALILWLNGQDEAAIEIFQKVGTNLGFIAMIQAGAGHYEEAAQTLLSGSTNNPLLPSPPDVIQEAVRLLRMAPATLSSTRNLKRLGGFDYVYMYVGAPEQVLGYFEINAEVGWSNVNNRVLSHSSFGPVRKTERYKAYARKVGLVEYWRAKGWPDFCQPVGTDDFECS